MKKALITGITGQDGSYLAELLLSKGYEVHGIIRRSSTFNTQRIDRIYVDPHKKDARMFLHYGDLTSFEQMSNVVNNVDPQEVYHLAAQSHVKVSFSMPEYTGDTTGLGTTRLLEIIRISGKKIKFYQASSSEMFGDSKPPQSENSIFLPRSPYAAAKLYAYWMARNYREGYNIFASNGILFNHESPRRGETFLTRKVTTAVARILQGKQKILYLGNLDALRDWGYVPEYVELMWKMLQKKKPGDFVVGTGETCSVRDFVRLAFEYAGMDYRKHIKTEKRYLRPTEVNALKADISKARKELEWKPKIKTSELVKIMVDADMRALGLSPIGEGDRILAKKFPKKWWSGD